MPVEEKLFHLPDRSRGEPDAGLLEFLKQNRDVPVRVSAAAVQRLDTRMLQLLLSAAKSWQSRQLDFRLCDVSGPLDLTLAQLGVLPEMLRRDGAA
jgi:anti-anti-sigma regulatory factor